MALLKPGAEKVIVDGTLGGGGHAEALLGAGARVVGLDRDPKALAAARARLLRFGDRFTAVQGEFGDAARLAPAPVDGLLLDLGVSSAQLDTPERGFSFQHDGPLDMRMGPHGETAAELIARLDEHALADVLYALGEERFSRPIARELKARRPKTTAEAVEAVKAAVPRKAWPRDIHVATRTFQALRLAVNRELEQLDLVLASLPALLRPGGVAAIISFHSLEDRAVKQAFRALCGEAGGEQDASLGAIRQHAQAEVKAAPRFRSLTKRPVVAGEAEVQANPRARSAKLRAVERLP